MSQRKEIRHNELMAQLKALHAQLDAILALLRAKQPPLNLQRQRDPLPLWPQANPDEQIRNH